MRKKKANPIHFGIEITKPHSKEMYDHNDKVAEELKMNISNAWKELTKNFTGLVMDMDWDGIKEDSKLVKLQKNVMYSGYGEGYTLEEVDREFRSEVDMMANWQLHETYSYLAFEKMLPRTSFMLVGFEWEKFDYHIIGSQEMMSPVIVKAVADDITKKLMKNSIDA